MSIIIHRNHHRDHKWAQRDEEPDTKAIHKGKHPITVAYWISLLCQQKLNVNQNMPH